MTKEEEKKIYRKENGNIRLTTGRVCHFKKKNGDFSRKKTFVILTFRRSSKKENLFFFYLKMSSCGGKRKKKEKKTFPGKGHKK
jgi:effector-binding domain-containing protein